MTLGEAAGMRITTGPITVRVEVGTLATRTLSPREAYALSRMLAIGATLVEDGAPVNELAYKAYEDHVEACDICSGTTIAYSCSTGRTLYRRFMQSEPVVRP